MSRETNFARKLIVSSPDRKPSVFERLGTKSGVASSQNVCHSWAQNGTCPLSKQCKLAQTHVLISPSKRLKSDTMKKSVVTHKKCKDEHKKSLRSHHSSDIEWEGWELGDLEDADERALERRKQELQRELQLQLKKEKELTRKKEKRTEKKRAASTSSSSTSTSESSSSSTSSSSSSSEPRKRVNRKRRHSSPSSESESERSLQRQKKVPKTAKTKITSVRKPLDKKDARAASDVKSKSVIVTKKTTAPKKSYTPNWDKSKGRSPIKQMSKKSPHRSPDVSKNKSSSPRYDKTITKSKRCYSPKAKSKESSPKRGVKKSKEAGMHGKEKTKQSPSKVQGSPSRSRKISPTRSRRHDDQSEKRRTHYEDQKHSSRRDRSREKDRKRDVTRGRSKDNDSNGGLKKGGKILPLKPPIFNKGSGIKKESAHHKSDKNATDMKSKDEERNRADRDKEREKDKNKCDRDKLRHKKPDDHDRRSARERESDRCSIRGRDDRGREREVERTRFAKDRESERQKEREEALERCRERQRERERLDKERKEKDEKKHQRDGPDSKGKDYDRELPSLLDLKAENPIRISGESGRAKSTDKHLMRDCHRSGDKCNDKSGNQDREGRERGSTDRDHERRDSRRSHENERKPQEKEYDSRRNREEGRNCSDGRGRSLGESNRRGLDEGGDSRRQWGDDNRRGADSLHDRRRALDPANGDRRQLPLGRRPEDTYRRPPRGENDVADLRDFAMDDRRGGRKPGHNCSDWDVKDQNFDYRDSEKRDDWNHPERHRDWNSRYDHKWMDREENREDTWNHYPRRGPHEDWSGDWSQEQPRQVYPESGDRMELLNEGYVDQSSKRHNENTESNRGTEAGSKEKDLAEKQQQQQDDCAPSGNRGEKPLKGDGDALSDISDDPDDILNQDDFPVEEPANVNNETRNSNQQIYIRSNEFLFDQRRPLLECLGERSLDFEEISDEELEEEARATKGIVDVLGADWAGLLQETLPKSKRHLEGPDSAHCSWMLQKLVSNLGISLKYAGQEFSDRIIVKCRELEQNEVKCHKGADDAENAEAVEGTKMEVDTEESSSVIEPMDEENSKLKIDAIFHPIPGLHSAMKDSETMKSVLFSTHNRFKRALSARADLSLRRELCNLPSKEPLHFTPPLDNRMYEISVQQFHRGATRTTAAV